MKKLPKQITPNPLISSVVEIRFSTILKTEDLITQFFPIIGNEFPLINYVDLPRQLKKNDPNFKYNPDFIFSNSDYSISIGTNILTFENIGEYHLWTNYFDVIKRVIEKIISKNFIQAIDRIGVRYISLFSSENTISKIMRINSDINYLNTKQTNNFIQTELINNNIRLVLRVAENGNVKKGEKLLNGLFVDIDASQSLNLPTKFDTSILDIIDKLHFEEKSLFYDLVNKEFLDSLNPQY